MVSQLTTNGEALRLFFTEDIYIIDEPAGTLYEEEQAAATDTGYSVAVETVIPMSANEPVVPLVKETVAEFKFLGNNKRNILILVNDADNEVSDEKGRELLRKIVKSINLTANDFALLNYAKYNDVKFAQLKDYFSSILVFAFGVSPGQLGLADHPENTIVAEEDIKFIFSAELRRLDEDQNGKKILWGSLKQLGL